MRWWGVIVGAIVGGLVGEFEPWGFALGALLGLGLQRWLERRIDAAVRERVDVASAALDARFAALAASVAAAPVAPVAAAAPEPARSAIVAPAIIVAPSVVEPPIEAAPTEPAPPAEPGIAARLIAAARDWLLGGNTIVRVGLLILFVGLSFLARYAAVAGLFPIELRLALVAAVGVALLAVGFQRRHARPEFALTLQGGGVAILYLTLFGGARLFGAIAPGPALAMMVAVCALGCALALLQRSQALAATAFAGGFAAPLLLGGDGGQVALFGYYAVLDLAVLWLAWRRPWRVVSLLGFFATFGVCAAWGAASYAPAEYATSQAFLILFVLIYLAVAVLQARHRPGRLGNIVDTTLLFGPALAGLGLQIGLVRHLQFGSAFSALAFAALYIGLAAALRRRAGPGYAAMTDAVIAIGVAFATLAVPLALGTRWTSAVWALEGAAAFWVGRRQARWLPRLFGLVLVAVAALLFVGGIGDNVARLPVVGPNTLGAALIAGALLALAWWSRTPAEASGGRLAAIWAGVEARLSAPLFVAAFAAWCLAFILELSRQLPPATPGDLTAAAIDPGLQSLLMLLGFALSAGAAALAARRLRWPVAAWPARLLLPAMALTQVTRMIWGHHVIDWPDAPIWLAIVALHGALLYLDDRPVDGVTDGAADARDLARRSRAHAGTVWLLALLLADALGAAIDRAQLWGTAWAGVSLLVAAVAALALLSRWAGRANCDVAGMRWPLDPHARAYWWRAAAPIAALVALLALIVSLAEAGNAAPLPYLPLLNPTDLAVALALGALLSWRRVVATADPRPARAAAIVGRPGTVALAALLFAAVNGVWLRVAHHHLGVAWDEGSLLGSSVVQTGLSILWTLLALALMLGAHRRAARTVWLAGAGLLGVVVAKLLLVDLSNAAGGERIVAFIVVGLLMLVVGYFAPLPPRREVAA